MGAWAYIFGIDYIEKSLDTLIRDSLYILRTLGLSSDELRTRFEQALRFWEEYEV